MWTRVVGAAFRGRVTRSVESFFGALGEAGVQAIPVTSPNQSDGFQAAIREVLRVGHAGAAIRIPVSLIHTGKASGELQALTAHLSVEPAEVDILVEYGLVDGVQPPSFNYVCHRLPEVLYSRTFTVLAGSFPPDLTGLKGPAQYELPRLEWTSWSTEITRSDDLPRRPSFGDYTVQHPVYREPVEGANTSASIRYASDDYWVVMRGEGLRNPGSPGHAQYVGNAQLLCQRKEFNGPQFSAGDDYIWKIASGRDPRFGNPETWIRAGINHHLVFAARQVQSAVSAAV